jgi:outer membrane protein
MKKTWTVLTLPVLIFLCVGNAQADFVGLNIGASHWAPELSGSFSGTGDPAPIDLSGDLGIDDDPSQSWLVLTLEHPIPLLPNLRYQEFDLNTSGLSNSSFIFNGTPFSGTINSTFDLSHDDIVLYYELLDNWVSLDLGLDIKVFDGEVEVNESGGPTETVLVDDTVPLFYISARFDLPYSGFYIGADINNNFNTGDGTAEDSSIMLGYESGSGLGLEGGIKKFSIDLDDINNLNTSLEYDGIYLNGYFHF